jgi:hypothetical protein
MGTPNGEQRREPMDTANVRRVGCKRLLAYEFIVVRISRSRTTASQPLNPKAR